MPDDDQRAAIEHAAGPLVVLAGPGTGKTFVIQQRVLHLVAAQGVRPEEVLCLTFTERAAEEMGSRVRAALAGAGVSGSPTVATFHSFCQDLLRRHAVEADVPRNFRVTSGARLLRFIMRHIDGFNLQRFRVRRSAIEFAQELEKFASRCHDELKTPEEALARARALAQAAGTAAAREQALVWEELAEAWRALAEELEDARFLTFGDLVSRAVRLLRERPEVLARVRGRYRYLLVDEFQDDNFAQGELVSLLAEPDGRVTVVGDDDQSIYRFRGAHPRILREFEERWRPRGLVKVVLRQSYRSTPQVLAAASCIIGGSPGHDPEKVIRPAEGPEGPPVKVVRAPDEQRQAEYLMARVRRALREGVPPQKVAVLFRSMGHAGPLARALHASEVPAEVVGAGGLLDRPEVRDLLAWASFAANPLSDDLAAFAVLWSPEARLDPTDVARVTRAAGAARKPVFEFVKDPARVEDLSAAGKARLEELAERAEGVQAEARQLPAGEALARVLEVSGLRARLDPDRLEGRRALRNIDQVLALAHEVASDTDHPGLETFVELMDLIGRNGLDLSEAEPDLAEASVKVMTVHQAKGKEFDLVLVPDLVERRFPPQGAVGLSEGFFVGWHHGETVEASQADEERRLLYVAMTRAARALELVTFQHHGGRRPAYPSPFLEELGVEDEGPPGPTAAGVVVEDFAPLAEPPAPPGPARGGQARLEEAVRGALAVLAGRPPEGREAARARVRELLGHLAAAHGSAGATLEVVRELEGTLGAVPVPAPREDAPVHHTRPGVREGPLDLSYSQLKTYESCPRQYLYGSVLNLRGRPSRHALAGSVIHSVLEEFLTSFKHTRDATLDDLLGIFEAQFARADFETELERRQHYEDGLEMMKRFYEDDRARTTEPKELEKWFEFELRDVRVRGKIDRIDRHPDGRFEVIDYKTGRVDSRRAYAEKDLQLPIYTMAMQEGLHLDMKCATIYALKDGKRITLNLGKDLTEGAIAAARTRILDIAEAVRAGRFDPDPEERKCSWCEFRMLCPASQSPG